MVNFKELFKEHLDEIYICYECRCGFCRTECPVYSQRKMESVSPRGKGQILQALVDEQIGISPKLAETLYSCNLCKYCNWRCPSNALEDINIDLPTIIQKARSQLVQEGLLLEGHKAALESIRNYGNPWLSPRARRMAWAKGLKLNDFAKTRPEVLFYIGCTTAYDAQLQRVARNMVTILEKAGVSFGVMGNDEICCGSLPLRLGDRALFEQLAQENIRAFQAQGVKTILTSCAGCYSTFVKEYPLKDIKVSHYTEYLAQLIDEGKLSLSGKSPMKVTYHDPCHLGRHTEVYDAPRKVLQAIKGLQLEEMERTRERAQCCGAGAGLRGAFPELATQIATSRLEQAMETGAQTLVTACPFCMQNLQNALTSADGLEVKELTDLVVEAL